jgi:hypothetical protein
MVRFIKIIRVKSEKGFDIPINGRKKFMLNPKIYIKDKLKPIEYMAISNTLDALKPMSLKMIIPGIKIR